VNGSRPLDRVLDLSAARDGRRPPPSNGQTAQTAQTAQTEQPQRPASGRHRRA
jgi:hypothetical protein